MLVLGLQGSPRRGGNTSLLLSAFLNEAERLGARTHNIEVARKSIAPCLECGVCEKEGYCCIDDDMGQVYPLLRQADIIVMATPVFFYGATAQMKALIDRTQVLWARRYIHKLVDPGRKGRLGLFLSLGATKGENLFEGISLTARYFFDAVGAGFKGSLTYRRIESAGQIANHPTAFADAAKKAQALVLPLLSRKRVLFVCRENACRSQMASAFARYHAGDRIEAESAGSAPARDVNPLMKEAMKEKGIDMAFCKPRSLKQAAGDGRPDLIVSMGCGETCPVSPGVSNREWHVPDPAARSLEFMRKVRDEIEGRVLALTKGLSLGEPIES